MFSQEDCEVWLPNILNVPSVPGEVCDKPIFLKLLRSLWAKNLAFDANITILVDDCRYKSLKNDYENCLAIRSYNPMVVEQNDLFYLKDIILPWLL